MAKRMGVAVTALLVALSLVSCGDDGGAEGATGPLSSLDGTGQGADVAAGERLFELVAVPFLERHADDDLVALLTAGCAALDPVGRVGDAGSFNEYLVELLVGDPTDAGLRREAADVEAALFAACGEHADDPFGFIETVGSALELDADELTQLVGEACDRHRIRTEANADDPFAPERYGDLLTRVTDAVPLGTDDLDDLVAAFCG